MKKVTQAMKSFAEVRDTLNQHASLQAFRKSHYKPLKFYFEHTKEEAIAILLKETGEFII